MPQPCLSCSAFVYILPRQITLDWTQSSDRVDGGDGGCLENKEHPPSQCTPLLHSPSFASSIHNPLPLNFSQHSTTSSALKLHKLPLLLLPSSACPYLCQEPDQSPFINLSSIFLFLFVYRLLCKGWEIHEVIYHTCTHVITYSSLQKCLFFHTIWSGVFVFGLWPSITRNLWPAANSLVVYLCSENINIPRNAVQAARHFLREKWSDLYKSVCTIITRTVTHPTWEETNRLSMLIMCVPTGEGALSENKDLINTSNNLLSN